MKFPLLNDTLNAPSTETLLQTAQQKDQIQLTKSTKLYTAHLSLPVNLRISALKSLCIDLLDPDLKDFEREENLEGLERLRFCIWRNIEDAFEIDPSDTALGLALVKISHPCEAVEVLLRLVDKCPSTCKIKTYRRSHMHERFYEWGGKIRSLDSNHFIVKLMDEMEDSDGRTCWVKRRRETDTIMDEGRTAMRQRLSEWIEEPKPVVIVDVVVSGTLTQLLLQLMEMVEHGLGTTTINLQVQEQAIIVPDVIQQPIEVEIEQIVSPIKETPKKTLKRSSRHEPGPKSEPGFIPILTTLNDILPSWIKINASTSSTEPIEVSIQICEVLHDGVTDLDIERVEVGMDEYAPGPACKIGPFVDGGETMRVDLWIVDLIIYATPSSLIVSKLCIDVLHVLHKYGLFESALEKLKKHPDVIITLLESFISHPTPYGTFQTSILIPDVFVHLMSAVEHVVGVSQIRKLMVTVRVCEREGEFEGALEGLRGCERVMEQVDVADLDGEEKRRFHSDLVRFDISLKQIRNKIMYHQSRVDIESCYTLSTSHNHIEVIRRLSPLLDPHFSKSEICGMKRVELLTLLRDAWEAVGNSKGVLECLVQGLFILRGLLGSSGSSTTVGPIGSNDVFEGRGSNTDGGGGVKKLLVEYCAVVVFLTVFVQSHPDFDLRKEAELLYLVVQSLELSWKLFVDGASDQSHHLNHIDIPQNRIFIIKCILLLYYYLSSIHHSNTVESPSVRLNTPDTATIIQEPEALHIDTGKDISQLIICDILVWFHDSLGILKYCNIDLVTLILQSCIGLDQQFTNDFTTDFYQAFYCTYGWKSSSLDLDSHKCCKTTGNSPVRSSTSFAGINSTSRTSLQTNAGTSDVTREPAEEVLFKFIHPILIERITSETFRSVPKDLQDALSKCSLLYQTPPLHDRRVNTNFAVIKAFLTGDIEPSLARSEYHQPLPMIDLVEPQSEISKSIFYIHAKIALSSYQRDWNTDFLTTSIQCLIFHLVQSPSHQQAWQTLAKVYVLFGTDILGRSVLDATSTKKVSDFQKAAWHCYIRTMKLEVAGVETGMKEEVWAEMGALCEAIVSAPMSGHALTRIGLKKKTPTNRAVFVAARGFLLRAVEVDGQWTSYLRLAHVSKKLGRDVHETMGLYMRGIALMPRENLSKDQDIVLDPVYKCVSFVWKMFGEGRMSVSEVVGGVEAIMAAHPPLLEPVEGAYEAIVTLLKGIKKLDKRRWYHRPSYRLASMYEQRGEFQEAQNEIEGVLKAGVKFRRIWKTDLEANGRHFVYFTGYVRMLGRLAEKTRDIGMMWMVFRKVMAEDGVIDKEGVRSEARMRLLNALYAIEEPGSVELDLIVASGGGLDVEVEKVMVQGYDAVPGNALHRLVIACDVKRRGGGVEIDRFICSLYGRLYVAAGGGCNGGMEGGKILGRILQRALAVTKGIGKEDTAVQ